VHGVASSHDLGDVQRESTHALGVGHVLHTANDDSQVPGDRGLQCQQDECRSFGSTLHLHEQLVVGDDLFGP